MLGKALLFAWRRRSGRRPPGLRADQLRQPDGVRQKRLMSRFPKGRRHRAIGNGIFDIAGCSAAASARQPS
jgi:hypothetical protein